MTDPATAELATGGDAQVIADLAQAAVGPTLIEDDLQIVVVPTGHHVERIDTSAMQPCPRRAKGAASTVNNVTAFIELVSRHMSDSVTLWANPDDPQIIAVLNDHHPTADKAADRESGTIQPGWRDWRVGLTMLRSDAWEEWRSVHRTSLGQTEFAEFVEDHLLDIIDPDGADLLEIAQTFQATTKVEFKSSKRLATGQEQLVYSEEIAASAGRAGEITVPQQFTIRTPIFVGEREVDIPVRLRYRIRGGDLTIQLVIDRPDERERDHFAAAMSAVEAELGVSVWTGRP